jgi:ribosome-associated toxin RatA of RatAB toxin-antitoxin module
LGAAEPSVIVRAYLLFCRWSMTHLTRSALLPYPAPAMFDLVNDIEAYPRYMDGCVGAKILLREEDVIEARLELAKGGIRQAFTTRNQLTRPSSIDMQLVDGPFSAFSGRWTFQVLNDTACKVTLDLRFSFTNTLLAMAAKSLFGSVADRMVDALVKRANELYGAAK